MANTVDGSGYLSDESSFYGSENTIRKLEYKAKRKLKLPYQWPVKRPRVDEREAPSHDVQPKLNPKNDPLHFLKTRPQIGELQETAAKDRLPRKKELARTVAGDEAADFLDDERFEGVRSAWQRSETVDDFLRRAPILDPRTAMLGPWVWIGNPQVRRDQSKHEQKADLESFKKGAVKLQNGFSAQRMQMEQSMPDKAPATITRKLRPYKDQLENDLLALAKKTSITCGKWMLFPSDEDYPRSWRRVAEATAEGKLGITSKAATPSDVDPVNLICVYTYDFTDMEDVQRVLEGLVDLGLCQKDGKALYYKCDAYTYLGINSGNDYKLRASLYSSKEIFAKEAEPQKEGPIHRVQVKNHTMEGFFDF